MPDAAEKTPGSCRVEQGHAMYGGSRVTVQCQACDTTTSADKVHLIAAAFRFDDSVAFCSVTAIETFESMIL